MVLHTIPELYQNLNNLASSFSKKNVSPSVSTCRDYNDALWYALRNVMHTILNASKTLNPNIKYHRKNKTICE